jgi:signal transduction histidine kinase
LHRVFEHTIEIRATPEEVWRTLARFEAYRTWNPFMTRVSGAAEVGSRLRIELEPPQGRRITVTPSVLVADPGRELRWRGRLPLGLFTGEHAYVIETAGTGARVTHQGWYRGLLVRLFGGTIDRTAAGFERMHQALKRHVEERAPGGGEESGAGWTIADLGIRGFEEHGEALLTEASRVVATVLGVDRVGVFGLARDGETLVLRAGVGWPPGGVGGVRATAGDGSPAGYAIAHSEPLVTTDALADRRLQAHATPETVGVIGGMAVRIEDGGRPLGVLDAWSRTRREFGGAEVAFVQAVAGLLGPALAVGASEARGHAAVAALLTAAEAERVRVAAELHDDTIQTLTAVRFTLDRLLSAWDRGDREAAAAGARAAETMLTDAIERTRRLTFGIVPPLLTEGGLAGAVRALPERILADRCDVEVDVHVGRHPDRIELLCYRAVEELLQNARRHARARHVRVVLQDEDGGVAGEVDDDGVGFTLDAVVDRPGRLGLLELAQWFDSAGGRMTIDSTPGRGTRVRFSVPGEET